MYVIIIIKCLVQAGILDFFCFKIFEHIIGVKVNATRLENNTAPAGAVLFSSLVALTLTPMMCSKILKQKKSNIPA